MRLTCPLCGERDLREFYYQGAATMLERPSGEDTEVWADWLHLRDNPAGRVRELWHHEAGCGSWLVVERDTVTHRVFSVALVEAVDAD